MTTMRLFDEGRTYSVGELTDAIAGALSVSFPDDIWVEGEIRNLRRPRSGHVYFDLVEPSETTGSTPAALLSVMLFRATREIVNKQLKRAGGGMRMDDGVLVRLRAVPDLYAPQGRLQLRMTGIDPTYTMGQLEMQRERLLALLRDEGLLEQNAALRFPPLPLRIGLVTAADSAAYADFCTELGASNIGFRVTLADTPTQGDMAPAGVAAAITTLAATRWTSSPSYAAEAPERTWRRSTTSSSPEPSPPAHYRSSPESGTRSTAASQIRLHTTA